MWALFEARHLLKAKTNFNIAFTDAIRNTLMTELAGDFAFSLRVGSTLRIAIRRQAKEENGSFTGRIESVRWKNAEGVEFKEAPGVFPLFLCLEQDSVVEDDGDIVTQSFVIADESNSQFAHRALGMLLSTALGTDTLHWRQLLRRKELPKLAQVDFRKAANDALENGFLRYGFNIQPAEMPAFLAIVGDGDGGEVPSPAAAGVAAASGPQSGAVAEDSGTTAPAPHQEPPEHD